MTNEERMEFVTSELEDLLKEFAEAAQGWSDFEVVDYARTIVDRWESDHKDQR